MGSHDKLISILLAKLAAEEPAIKSQWRSPSTVGTRYCVVDNLLDPSICTDIFNAFPKGGGGFVSRKSFRERKLTSADLVSYPEVLGDITYALQSKSVLSFVQSALDLDELEPDPMLYAGGLSMMFEGDFLNPHIDNSHDAARGRYRRLNLLYYVSPDWILENGGNFELWDTKVRNKVTIGAFFNRLVIMETNKFSWHSVSPVRVKDPRCCVSTYYFSKKSPDASEYFHVTSFTGRPEQRARRLFGIADNILRSAVAKIFRVGRGKHLVNKGRGATP